MIHSIDHIVELRNGKFRLYSRKRDPKTGERRNLGTFNSRKEALAHERAVEYFKHHDTEITDMPYASNADLPPAVKKNLPTHAQNIFRAAFNNFMKGRPSGQEQAGFRVAWAAVKRKFKQVSGKWVAKDDGDLLDEFEFEELIQFDESNIRPPTRDGYLVANPRVARTGIQLYRGMEVGKPEMDMVRVYRPEDQVFSHDAMASLAHRPITNDHPSEAVTSQNWRKYSVGNSDGDVARDGEYIRVPMMVMDQAAIDDIANGKSQLSVGYNAKLVWGEGVTPDGETYDAMQTDIRANHIAIVKMARGGPKLRIGDHTPTEVPTEDDILDDILRNNGDLSMNERMTTLDCGGIKVEMPDHAAQVVQRELQSGKSSLDKVTQDMAGLTEQITQLNKKLEDAQKEIQTRDAKITTLEQQVKDAAITPQKLDAMVRDHATVAAKAAAILGSSFKADGMSIEDMRKAVVTNKLGDAAKDWNADQIKASFDTLTAGIDTSKPVVSGVDSLASIFTHSAGAPSDPRAAALAARDQRLADAWKGPQNSTKQ